MVGYIIGWDKLQYPLNRDKLTNVFRYSSKMRSILESGLNRLPVPDAYKIANCRNLNVLSGDALKLTARMFGANVGTSEDETKNNILFRRAAQQTDQATRRRLGNRARTEIVPSISSYMEGYGTIMTIQNWASIAALSTGFRIDFNTKPAGVMYYRMINRSGAYFTSNLPGSVTSYIFHLKDGQETGLSMRAAEYLTLPYVHQVYSVDGLKLHFGDPNESLGGVAYKYIERLAPTERMTMAGMGGDVESLAAKDSNGVVWYLTIAGSNSLIKLPDIGNIAKDPPIGCAQFSGFIIES